MLTRHDAVDRYDHSSLRYVIYAGSPMYRADQVHALRKLGKVLVQYFGMGEVTGNITVLPPDLHSLDDARDAGRKLRISAHRHGGRDPGRRWQRLPPGATGEICVRGPGVFAGYHNNPEATAQATRFGWFHTGDLGHMDARGLRLHHRPRVGHVHLRRIQRVSARDRGGAADASRRGRGLRRRHAGRALGRERRRGAGAGARARRSTKRGCWRISTAGWRNTNGRRAFVFWPELPKSGYGKVTKREVKRLLEESIMMPDAPKDHRHDHGLSRAYLLRPSQQGPRRNCCGSGWRSVSPDGCAWDAGTMSRWARTCRRCTRSHSRPSCCPRWRRS